MTEIGIRLLAETDLGDADRVFRLAFGTQFGLAEPMSFRGDAGMVRPRWSSDPAGALGAFRDTELIGSAFAARWGSFGVLGPITVRPDCWGSGVGKRLLEPAMALFESWGIKHIALFTFPQSTKHVALYQKFGFWPQFLTVVLSKAVEHPPEAAHWFRYSDSPWSLPECAALTGSIFPGLDLEREIRGVHDQKLGDTVLLRDGARLQGLAVCHIGKGSEAGTGATYVKFAAVRPGQDAQGHFERLLAACEALALDQRSPRIIAGVNTARHAAYRKLLQRGYQGLLHGVAMQRPNRAGYNTPDHFVIDDWR